MLEKKIMYKKKYPLFRTSDKNNFKKEIKPLITKFKDWKYEKEYRLIIDKNNVPIKIDDTIIVEVILGVNMCDKYRKEIKNILRSINQNIKLFKAELDNQKYGLKFKEIDY